jgi:hypothetical protein
VRRRDALEGRRHARLQRVERLAAAGESHRRVGRPERAPRGGLRNRGLGARQAREQRPHVALAQAGVRVQAGRRQPQRGR